MGKLTSFSIQLSSAQTVFHPGQVVAGYLLIDLKEPMRMRGIQMKFTGKGECIWSETHGTGKNFKLNYYRGREILFSQESQLFGSKGASGSDKVTLAAGKQSFHFSFSLPKNIPSSFESYIGSIQYILKGKIDKSQDHKTKLRVTVEDFIDPNLPMYSAPLNGEKHKEVGILGSSGTLDLSASIDRSAYFPGESIVISANIENQSTRDMDRVYAKLIKTVEYRALNKTRTDSDTVAKLDGPPIPQKQNVRWEKQLFGIPELSPTIRHSTVISVGYSVQVLVDVPWGFNAKVSMDILIGTTPYIAKEGRSVAPSAPKDLQSPPKESYQADCPPRPPEITDCLEMPPPPPYSAVVGNSQFNTAKHMDIHGDIDYTPAHYFAQPHRGIVPPYNPSFHPPDGMPQQFASTNQHNPTK